MGLVGKAEHPTSPVAPDSSELQKHRWIQGKVVWAEEGKNVALPTKRIVSEQTGMFGRLDIPSVLPHLIAKKLNDHMGLQIKPSPK